MSDHLYLGFYSESLKPFLLSTETIRISALLSSGLQIGYLALYPVKLQNLANSLRGDRLCLSSLKVTDVTTLGWIKCQNLCWFLCLPSSRGHCRSRSQPPASSLLSSPSSTRTLLQIMFQSILLSFEDY